MNHIDVMKLLEKLWDGGSLDPIENVYNDDYCFFCGAVVGYSAFHRPDCFFEQLNRLAQLYGWGEAKHHTCKGHIWETDGDGNVVVHEWLVHSTQIIARDQRVYQTGARCVTCGRLFAKFPTNTCPGGEHDQSGN